MGQARVEIEARQDGRTRSFLLKQLKIYDVLPASTSLGIDVRKTVHLTNKTASSACEVAFFMTTGQLRAYLS